MTFLKQMSDYRILLIPSVNEKALRWNQPAPGLTDPEVRGEQHLPVLPHTDSRPRRATWVP